MDFQEPHKGTDCDYIALASQNCSDTFSRKTSDGKMKDRNFRISKKYREVPFIDCEKHCALNSVSIDLWNEESQE